jgi:hypothetical protein
MSKGDVHTLPHKGGWANKIEGSSRVANTAAKKAEAQAKGRAMAIRRKVEHLIHKRTARSAGAAATGPIRAAARARQESPPAEPMGDSPRPPNAHTGGRRAAARRQRAVAR